MISPPMKAPNTPGIGEICVSRSVIRILHI